MRISSFHIDGFGIFADVTVEDLPPGLSIFLGSNEAGKSSCLEFLRAMLTGYPNPRNREFGRARPLRGGEPGGSLRLILDDGASLDVIRRPGSGAGSLRLTNDAGEIIPADELSGQMHGVSREVYRNVFSFGLGELERFESLSSDAVRNALYGASFGGGIRPPAEALQELDRRREEFFRKGGSKPLLNAAVKDLEDLRARIEESQAQCAGFDRLALDLRLKKNELAELRSRKAGLESERLQLERRLGAWRQWEEWKLAGARLERIGTVPQGFPQDGPASLARIQEAIEAAERQLAASSQKAESLAKRLADMPIDESLLASLPALRRLAERKSSYRQALSRLPALEGVCARLEEDIRGSLNQLGPGWSLERIRSTDRSLFCREDLERQARDMTTADLAHQASLGALATANREVENAESITRAAEENYRLLPSPPAEIDGRTRDEIRQNLARIEDMQRQIPLKKENYESARIAFGRAITPLRMDRLPPEDVAESLESIASRRPEALALASDIQEKLRHASEAVSSASQAEEMLNAVKKRMENLRDRHWQANAPTREALEKRSSALRSLRALSAQLDAEEERIRELDVRILAHRPPAPIKSWPLAGIGAIGVAAGAAIILAHTFLGIENLELRPGLIMPMDLWSGYLVVACGVGFLAGAFSGSGPEGRRLAAELAQLRSRREQCALHKAELGDRARQLREAAGVEKIDTVSLEATEVLLEREKEQFFQEEQARREMDGLQAEFEECRQLLGSRQELSHEAEANVQKARKRWHEFMQSLGVDNVPSPEGADAYFAQANSALAAREALISARKEWQASAHDLERLLERTAALPGISSRLASENPDESAICKAAMDLLDSCREADAAREQRIRAAAALENHRNERDRAQKRQAEIGAQLMAGEERLRAAKERWATLLRGLGIDEQLSPETVREAFKHMENCLASEAELAGARVELKNARAELAALQEPLAPLLLQFSAQGDAAGMAPAPNDRDWLASLDELLNRAEEMSARKQDAARVSAQLEEEMDEARGHEAALAAAKNRRGALLASGEAGDAEDFLRLASLRQERLALERRREDLEDALRLAAGDTCLDEFLQSFEEMDQASLEKRGIVLEQDIARLQDEEHELATAVVRLGSESDRILHDEGLARMRQEEEQKVESMRQLALEWSSASLARLLILRAKQKFEQERQPEVIRQASEIFSRITDSRWRGLGASLEDSSLRVLPAHGEPVDPADLSRGAQEQAYLSLRLAYILDHARHAPALPILMDEILVNFDPERAERTVRALARLSSGQLPHQVLYFTCHPHMAKILRSAAPDAVIYSVSDGGINRTQDA